MRFPVLLRSCLFLASVGLALGLPRARADDLGWPEVGREQKPWTRWWWLGNGVDQENLSRELKDFAAHGLGGVEVTPVYGAKGYEKRFIKYLSPDYMAMLAYTASEAHRLGLGVDMATTTGWPFGGPWVGPADAEQRIVLKDGKLSTVPTGFKVKRSAPGGEGPVVNPFSPGAVARYLQPFTQALATVPRGTISAQFQDSYEFTASWAAEVPGKFKAMHGYDLMDHLAELGGQGSADTVARIKGDYRETLAELHLEFVQTWVDWSHREGSLAREQAHGAPGNLLDIYGISDVPETEIFGSSPFPIPLYRNLPAEIGINVPYPLVNRMASSAAHVAGRPLASAETFTWVREHFHEAPSEMKPELDQLFLTGINRIYYQGNAYSPSDAPWPGWLFYASVQENSRNSLWDQFGWLNAYIGRSSALLQAGVPDNDLLVYWPVYDLWHDAAGTPVQHPDGLVKQFAVHNGRKWMVETSCGKVAAQLAAGGYAFDYISDAQLGRTQVEQGTLRVPGGAYRAVIVPPTAHLPVATLQHLLALAESGATVVFIDSLPADVPGFGQLDERRAQFKTELARLDLHDTGNGLRSAAVGRGRVLVGAYGSVIAQTGATREPIADSGLGVLRRRTDEGEIYFIANLTGQAFDGWAQLGRGAKGAVLLDARSGQTGVAALAKRGEAGLTRVYLQLQPGESIFLKTFRDRAAQGARWAYASEAGPAMAIDGRWRVTFTSGGPVLPPAFTESALKSWTEQGGEAERFAGTARYETEFNLPGGAAADDWLLDLGDLRETATVWLNGTKVDDLWSLPFRTRVGAQLLTGRNHLTLEVTNLSANRIRDLDVRKVPWKKFYEINFVNINYRPLDASQWPLQPSGLLGPVRLIPLHALTP
jgi:alpha-L-rhamnosidase